MNKLWNANPVLKQSKCEFIKSEIKFLGHVINADGISTDPEKVDSIVKFPTPKKVNDVRTFLGLTGYCRRFSPNYSKTITPLLASKGA